MPHTSRADLSHAFCSYCGYPPMGRWRDCAHRVCMRCQMGVVLRAPEGAEPGHDDPFLIVDRELAVQAVSRNAELVLSGGEPASLGVPLEQFLICCNGGRAASAIGRSRVRRCQPSCARTTQRRGPRAPSSSTVTTCGAPGALLILKLPRNARNGVSKRSAARQPASRNRGFPGQRDMIHGSHRIDDEHPHSESRSRRSHGPRQTGPAVAAAA
jgi:hypothetical protein